MFSNNLLRLNCPSSGVQTHKGLINKNIHYFSQAEIEHLEGTLLYADDER